MNAEMGPASRIQGIGGFVTAQTLTAAGRVQPHRKPRGGWSILQKNRVAFSAGERTLTAGIGHPSERRATVSGAR